MNSDAYAGCVKSFQKTRCDVSNCETKQIKGCLMRSSKERFHKSSPWQQIVDFDVADGAQRKFARRRRQ
jgi:hypothetical protein